jgi:carbamoyl-phosphate synthase large subunit
MNILLTCAGRRNYLVSYFREALNGRGRVYAADASPHAPAMYEADVAVGVPLLNDVNYVEKIVSICAEEKIGMLLSLNDAELPVLALHRAKFLEVGTIPLVSSPEVINVCGDKWATIAALGQWGVDAPLTYCSLADAKEALARGDLAFPVVVKPRWGTASIGIEFAEDFEELECTYRMVKRRVGRSIVGALSVSEPEHPVLIQRYLSGPEYGLDVINDLEGNHVTTIVKQKLSMRAGETDCAVTLENAELRRLGETLGRRLGHVGNLDCDVFLAGAGFSVLEMNPRFGGGYPFSHIAGVDLPACLIAWASGEDHNQAWLTVRPNIAASKYDRLIEVYDVPRANWVDFKRRDGQ